MLVSTLQLSVMISKASVVQEHVPSVASLGNELRWTAFQFRPPSFLRSDEEKNKGNTRRLSEDAADAEDAVESVAQSDTVASHLVNQVVGPQDTLYGSAIWLWGALGILVALHGLVHYASHHYFAPEETLAKPDDDDKLEAKEMKRKKKAIKRKTKGLRLMKRILPRAELYLSLIAFQGVGQACLTSLASSETSSEQKGFALFTFIAGPCVLFAWSARWLWANTRGPIATVHFKVKKNKWSDHRHNKTKTHVIDKWGILFQDFRPAYTYFDGMPEGFLVLLAHKLTVSFVIGVMGGPTREEARAQTICLVLVFLALAAYLSCGQPFIDGRVNFAETCVAVIQASCVFMNLWNLAEDNTLLGGHISKGAVEDAVFYLMLAALGFQLVRLMYVTLPRWQGLPKKLYRACRAVKSAKKERKKRKRKRKKRRVKARKRRERSASVASLVVPPEIAGMPREDSVQSTASQAALAWKRAFNKIRAVQRMKAAVRPVTEASEQGLHQTPLRTSGPRAGGGGSGAAEVLDWAASSTLRHTSSVSSVTSQVRRTYQAAHRRRTAMNEGTLALAAMRASQLHQPISTKGKRRKHHRRKGKGKKGKGKGKSKRSKGKGRRSRRRTGTKANGPDRATHVARATLSSVPETPVLQQQPSSVSSLKSGTGKKSSRKKKRRPSETIAVLPDVGTVRKLPRASSTRSMGAALRRSLPARRTLGLAEERAAARRGLGGHTRSLDMGAQRPHAAARLLYRGRSVGSGIAPREEGGLH